MAFCCTHNECLDTEGRSVKRFANPRNAKAHIEPKHLDLKRYICQLPGCSYMAADRSAIRRHCAGHGLGPVKFMFADAQPGDHRWRRFCQRYDTTTGLAPGVQISAPGTQQGADFLGANLPSFDPLYYEESGASGGLSTTQHQYVMPQVGAQLYMSPPTSGTQQNLLQHVLPPAFPNPLLDYVSTNAGTNPLAPDMIPDFSNVGNLDHATQGGESLSLSRIGINCRALIDAMNRDN